MVGEILRKIVALEIAKTEESDQNFLAFNKNLAFCRLYLT